MELSDIIMGVIMGVIIWKLLKITLKTFFWVLLAGLIAAVLLPDQLPLIGEVGVTILSLLGSLLVLAVGGFLFFTGD